MMRWLAIIEIRFCCRYTVGTGAVLSLFEAHALVKGAEKSSGTKVGFECVRGGQGVRCDIDRRVEREFIAWRGL